MLITSFQSNCVPDVSSVSEDIDNFRRNRSRGCGFVQNCLKSLIIKDKHLWNRMCKTIHFHEGKLKVYPQVVKSHSQVLQKRSVINSPSTWIPLSIVD